MTEDKVEKICAEKRYIFYEILEIRDEAKTKPRQNKSSDGILLVDEILISLLAGMQTRALDHALWPRLYSYISSAEIRMCYSYEPKKIKNIFNEFDKLQKHDNKLWEDHIIFWQSIITGLLLTAVNCEEIEIKKIFLQTTQKIINRLKFPDSIFEYFALKNKEWADTLNEVLKDLTTSDEETAFFISNFFHQLNEGPLKNFLSESLFEKFTQSKTPTEKEKMLYDYFIDLKK